MRDGEWQKAVIAGLEAGTMSLISPLLLGVENVQQDNGTPRTTRLSILRGFRGPRLDGFGTPVTSLTQPDRNSASRVAGSFCAVCRSGNPRTDNQGLS
jgi:hypothetical protein